MNLRSTPSGSERGFLPEDVEALLDLLHGALPAPAQQALRARLAAEPALAREYAALERVSSAARRALEEPADAVLARRLSLRVRDQVSREEEHSRREAGRSSRRWSSRTFARVLLASLAVHVVVLGWVLLRDPAPASQAVRAPVGVAVRAPEVRDPALLEELSAPPELGPLVAAEWVPDALLERRGLESPETPGSAEGVSAEPAVRVAEHPWPVQLDMLARSRPAVRRGRLVRAGVDASRAIERVTNGLAALAARQRPDGSFPPDLTVEPAARAPYGPLGLTGLALLPFLGEGRRSTASAAEAADPVVLRGVTWLRQAVASDFASWPTTPTAPDLALGLLALSEDYMLCYGRFDPATASRRAGEVAGLARRLAALQASDGSFPGAGDTRLWPLLALDAAQHTGVVSTAEQSLARLARWFEGLPRSADGVPLGADGKPDPALAAGWMVAGRGLGAPGGVTTSESTGVLLASASVEEVSPTSLAAGLALYRGYPAAFGAWNRTQAASQAARLGPAGLVLRGDPVADTALVLLALQSAYRAY